MSDPAPAADGFHHPAGEAELVALVKAAHRQGRQLRVRGAAHSVSHAIYTDPAGARRNQVGEQSPPEGDGIDVMLDRYRGWRVRDEGRRLVEADAGIHLGPDPSDPSGDADLDASLLGQLAKKKGWTLSDTGGITHQTVSGFTATASAGGSLRFSATANVWGFRLIDGRGELHEVSREDADPDRFYAMCPNLGLLGVVSAVIFECVEAFDVEGSEATDTLASCPVELFGEGGDGRPSIAGFLSEAEFARIEWWPQRGADRVVTWQARSRPADPNLKPVPYQRFGDDPETNQLLTGVIFTIIGNLDNLGAAKPKLEDNFDELQAALDKLGEKQLGDVGEVLVKALGAAIEFGVDAAITVLQPFASLIERQLPDFLPRLLTAFVELDADKDGAEQGKPQEFRDRSWRGLPMDNGGNDVLVPVEFTEAWVPLSRSVEAMRLLRDYFDAPADDGEALERTGTFSWELYGSVPERFWLNPSYSDGADEWRDGVLRIDPYWFVDNRDDPAQTLFAGLWSLLREAGIPFRLHWGKFQPHVAEGDRDWPEFFRAQYPRWDDFLALRAERDPNNIFLTEYWRNRFGLWDEPQPVPQDT